VNGCQPDGALNAIILKQANWLPEGLDPEHYLNRWLMLQQIKVKSSRTKLLIVLRMWWGKGSGTKWLLEATDAE